MPRLTVTITEEQADLFDEITQDGGEYESKSATVRDFIQTGEEHMELEQEIARLEERLANREERIDTLEKQLSRRSQVEEKVDVLAKRVEDQDRLTPPWPIQWWRYIRGQGSNADGDRDEDE